MRGRHIGCTALRWWPLTTQRPPLWLHVAEVATADQPEAATLAARQRWRLLTNYGPHTECALLRW